MGCLNDTDANRATKKEMKIILLGIGGSGKTTFSKQMQFIHQGSYDRERAQSYKTILLANVLIGLKAIASKARELEESENYKKSRWIQSLDETQIEWDAELVAKIKSLWSDEGIQTTWEEVKDTVIIQMEYLMENLDGFVQPDFVPTNADILRARQRTTGASITRFEDPKTIWNLIDVGGQYSERTKWEGFFTENLPHAVIFFLALDEFNVPNAEVKTDNIKTKFELALQVFKDTMCSEGPVLDYELCRIVFLNKVDIFEEKIKDDRKFLELKEVLDYDGPNTVTQCTDHVIAKLKSISDEKKPNADLKIHVTCALDTEMMKKVSNDIKSSIITSTLIDLGML